MFQTKTITACKEVEQDSEAYLELWLPFFRPLFSMKFLGTNKDSSKLRKNFHVVMTERRLANVSFTFKVMPKYSPNWHCHNVQPSGQFWHHVIMALWNINVKSCHLIAAVTEDDQNSWAGDTKGQSILPRLQMSHPPPCRKRMPALPFSVFSGMYNRTFVPPKLESSTWQKTDSNTRSCTQSYL